MKGKFKLILLSMLALFLVACGSATPNPDGGGTGGGTSGGTSGEITPKPGGGTGGGGGTGTGGDTGGGTKPVDSVKWQDIKEEIKKEVKYMTGKDVIKEDPINKITLDDGEIIVILKNDFRTEYSTDAFKSAENKRFIVSEYDYLEFKENVGEIKFKSIKNKGDMFFVDDLSESRVYQITLDRSDDEPDIYKIGLVNEGLIYVMDGNGGSTLKIDGDYTSYEDKGKIYLGLYVSEDNKEFSTDKVHILKDVLKTTEVKFIYNEAQARGLVEDANYHGKDEDNFVIKVTGLVKDSKGVKENQRGEAFKMDGTVPIGKKYFILKYDEGSKGKTDSHLWKLEEKK